MNSRKMMVGLLTGLVIALFMMVPVSATTVIDFEGLSNGLDMGLNDPYKDSYGITFPVYAKIGVSPHYSGYSNYPPRSGDAVFYNSMDQNTQIDFASPVSRVKIWFTANTGGYIDAYDSDGNIITSDSKIGNNFGRQDSLEVSGSNIAYVILHDAGNQITYDDLEFDTQTAIPEFPTVAIPVISVIGLMFLMSSNRRSK